MLQDRIPIENSMNDKKLIKILSETRKWAESQCHPTSKFDADLAGFCAIGAHRLHTILSEVGYKVSIGLADDGNYSCHCFVILDSDDLILDVTATQFYQFRDTRVNIIPVKEAEQYWFYNPRKIFRDTKRFRKFLIRDNWTAHQIPLSDAGG